MQNHSKQNFTDFVEVLNENSTIWYKRWICIEKQKLTIYDRKPSNYYINIVTELEYTKPKSTHSLSRITFISHKEFKYKFTRKPNVVELHILQPKTEKLYISLKNDKMLQLFTESISQGEELNNTFTLKTKAPYEQTTSDVNVFTSNDKMTFRENMKENKKPKHNKNRSCEFIDTKMYLTEIAKQKSKPLATKSNFHFNNGTRCLHNYNTNLNKSQSKDLSRNASIDKTKTSLLNCSKSPIRKVHLTPEMYSGKTNYKAVSKNEANTSISQLINNMISESGKVKKSVAKCTDSFANDSFSNMIDTKNTSNVRNKQLSKIIKLTLPNADFYKKTTSDNKLNFNTSFTNLDGIDSSVNNSEENIKSIVQRLEEFEEYYCDSYILKKLLASYNLKKSDLGFIYNSLTKDYLKSALLSEMISILSKKYLNESILKSLEVVLKEKEMNCYYTINSSHQHSIEYCIIDIFNTFLGNNRESEEFYSKILPPYLTEQFKIYFILNIKDHISIPSLFIQMQFHNKIYFSENIDINFNDSNPFVSQDIKFISPYYVNKWYCLASEGLTVANTNLINSTTNIKRMKFNNFEMRESIDTTCSRFRENERMNEEYRILLIKNIHYHILNKKSEIALKLCDYYVQKYTETIFLNPIIYIILAEVYNESSGVELARLFFEKAVNILIWQFGKFENPLLIDMYYTFSLILMKQGEVVDYLDEIEGLLNRSINLCEKFFSDINEKKVKLGLQLCLLEFTRSELDGQNIINFSNLLDSIVVNLDYLNKKEKYREECVYLNLFIDHMKNIPSISEQRIRFVDR
jgi:hypothetical protein